MGFFWHDFDGTSCKIGNDQLIGTLNLHQALPPAKREKYMLQKYMNKTWEGETGRAEASRTERAVTRQRQANILQVSQSNHYNWYCEPGAGEGWNTKLKLSAVLITVCCVKIMYVLFRALEPIRWLEKHYFCFWSTKFLINRVLRWPKWGYMNSRGQRRGQGPTPWEAWRRVDHSGDMRGCTPHRQGV